jgi:hypothetical protein
VADDPKPAVDPNLDSKEEFEAKTEMLKAETALIQVRHGLVDRLIMRGVIPIALIVAGPITTYYFSQRANDGIEEVRRIGDSVEKLDAVIEAAKTAASRHDDARAAELIALRRIVSSLQWNVVVTQAREVTSTMGRRLLRERMAGPTNPTFDQVRQSVEDDLYAYLAPRVDSDPQLLKEALRGAVDEIRPPNLIGSVTGEPVPPPRFPIRGQ